MSNPRVEAFKKMKTWFETSPGFGGDRCKQLYFNDKEDAIKGVLMGIDWAADSGMLRGDVIKRDGNVIHMRFKTWEIGD